ncbi:hypothetical protein [Rhizosaccharibacter radicis]|uniref:Uncharacterized protein n=1 Tax=Rhizosaccharibacter radicis TaxID=2782605 RepID=A0ABT1VSP8_9PROT|nr:hypothetical protein [Acetobacteraceae bacterium KSS12]
MVATNCLAQGIGPATFQQSGSQIETLQGVNPNLRSWMARTCMIGTVPTPRRIPNLSMSIDYDGTRIAPPPGAINTGSDIHGRARALVLPRNVRPSLTERSILSGTLEKDWIRTGTVPWSPARC